MAYPDLCEKCHAPIGSGERDLLDLSRLGATGKAVEWRRWWLCSPFAEEIRAFLLNIEPLGPAGEGRDSGPLLGRQREEADEVLAGIIAAAGAS